MAEPQSKSTKTTKTTSKSTSTSSNKKSNKKLFAIIAGIIGGIVVIGLIIFAICKITGGGSQWSDTSDFKFRVKVAAGLEKISKEDATDSFDVDSDAPLVAYMNKDQTVGIALTQEDTEIENDDMEQYFEVMKKALGSNVIDSELYEVDGHKIASIKTNIQSSYNHIIFFPDDNKKLSMIDFVCAEDERDAWEKKGDEMIKSLEFVK